MKSKNICGILTGIFTGGRTARFYVMAKTHSGEEIDRSSNSTNYTEFTVKKSSDAKTVLIRALLIVVYVSIVVGIWVAAWWLGAISALLVAIAWFFTWPLTNIEYEYTTSSGDWRFEKIVASKRRKVVLDVKIKDMEIIAPYTSEYSDKYKSASKVYDFRKSAKQTEDVYFALFEENGAKSLILFQCTNKALKIFASYNKAGTVKCDTLRY